MQKKIQLVVILMWCFFSTNCFASDSINADEVIRIQLEMFNWEEIEKLEQQLQQSVPELSEFDLREEVSLILSGQSRWQLGDILGFIVNRLLGEFFTYISVVIRFILIIIVCNILSNLSSAFESDNTTKVAFFVCNIVVLYSLMQSLILVVDLAYSTIETLQSIMLVILPTILAFMASSGYIATSAALSPIIVTGLTVITFVIQNLMLPSVVGIIVLQVISNMSDEFKIDKFIQLYYKISKWMLKTIFFASIALMGIYRMSLPFVDTTMKRVGVTLSAKFIPILGSAVSGAIDMIIGISGMIKNAFGFGVIVWIVLLVSMPLIKMLAYTLLYYFAGAIIEPIGDKKMANIATDIAKGCEFVMSIVGVVAILCTLAVAICMSIGASLM
ncbi:MAG: hypothetical protein BEN19_01550 [Epulopiscium sp. Nuni2H_MBin003]|nr:MAG: hypothetical protein BEN19_01550 [Epulopiscium sp. Nuni2H_MBin003]